MLSYYTRRSVGEDFQRIQNPRSHNVWVRGDQVSAHELQHLAEVYGLNYGTLNDILDENELPRVETRGNETYVFLRTAQHTKRGEVRTMPFLVVLKDSVFLTLSTAIYNDHFAAITSLPGRHTNAVHLLLGSFAAVIGGYEELIQQTAKHIKDTGHRLRTHEVNTNDFIRFVTIEDNLKDYHINLGSMQAVAERLKSMGLSANDMDALDDILLYIRQLLVAIDSHTQNVTSIRNAYSTIANNTLNQRMKLLTALTVLITLPNVFFGMYGMNVALPLDGHPWAFAGIVTFTLGLILGVFLLAKRFRIF